mmetsp:Transcript_72443/g.114874  ORF Transcript_72443/g.114874 Transcript_72443/m.114874 type:complete len:218 (+) Transcript_72443:785-1438(+)
MVHQFQGQRRCKDFLPHHTDHQLQPLQVAKRNLVGLQEHQRANAVEHVLNVLCLLAVSRVAFSVGRNTAEKLINTFKLHHLLSCAFRVLQHNAQDFRGIHLVVIHALCTQAFDQPGQEGGNLQELSTSLLRHQVCQVFDHTQPISDGLEIFITDSLVNACEDINCHLAELSIKDRLDKALRIFNFTQDFWIREFTEHFKDIDRDVCVHMVEHAHEQW